MKQFKWKDLRQISKNQRIFTFNQRILPYIILPLINYYITFNQRILIKEYLPIYFLS